jgi:hypothetical protein
VPLPAVWVEPIWLGVQILLILLAGYLPSASLPRA